MELFFSLRKSFFFSLELRTTRARNLMPCKSAVCVYSNNFSPSTLPCGFGSAAGLQWLCVPSGPYNVMVMCGVSKVFLVFFFLFSLFFVLETEQCEIFFSSFFLQPEPRDAAENTTTTSASKLARGEQTNEKRDWVKRKSNKKTLLWSVNLLFHFSSSSLLPLRCRRANGCGAALSRSMMSSSFTVAGQILPLSMSSSSPRRRHWCTRPHFFIDEDRKFPSVRKRFDWLFFVSSHDLMPKYKNEISL